MKIKQNRMPRKVKKISVLIVLILVGLLVPKKGTYSFYEKKNRKNNSSDFNSPKINFDTCNDAMPDLVPKAKFAKVGLLFDMTENKVIWVKGVNQRCDIASVSKMMTILLVMESLEAHKYSWDSLVCVPREAMYVGGSSVFLNEGEVFTVRDLVKSALIASGNDAAYVLAKYTGGNEKNFVRMMNWRAYELGMDSTFFSNSTGMPTFTKEIDNYSTPHDLLLLAIEVLKHKEVLEYTHEWEDYIYHGLEKFSFQNHNSLVLSYQNEVDGLKTGFTPHAGFCLVATANRANHRIISILMGVENSVWRDEIVGEMMSNYYSQIGLGKLGDPIN